MATLIVNGEQFHVPEMNFLAVERAWPYVQAATTEFDPIKGSAAAIAVIAAAMFEADGFDRGAWDLGDMLTDQEAFLELVKTIKRRMKANEIQGAKDTMLQILQEGGLQLTEGEILQSLGLVADEDQSSPETAENTSPSLLPQE